MMRVQAVVLPALAAAAAFLSVLLAQAAGADDPPAPVCRAAREQATGWYARCHARAAAGFLEMGRAAFHASCDALLDRFLDSRGACPQAADAALTKATFRGCLDGARNAILGGDPALARHHRSRCDGQKVRAAGRYLQCLQGASARATRQGVPIDPAEVARCESKLRRSLLRASAMGACSATDTDATLKAHLDACREPLDPALTVFEGTLVVIDRYPDGQPKQIGVAVEDTGVTFWLRDGLEHIYFYDGDLTRDLMDDIGRPVRVWGRLQVGNETIRSLRLRAYELAGEVVVTKPVFPIVPTESIEGTVVVIERYENGHPRVLGIAPDGADPVPLVETHKSRELRYRVGRRLRVEGGFRGGEALTVQAFTELEGSPLVEAGDGFRMSFLAGGYDENDLFMGGTEVNALHAFDGRIFAGASYRFDDQERSPDPGPPGAQVLVLDHPDGRWKVDFTMVDEVDRRPPRFAYLDTVRFETDASGAPLEAPVEMLGALGGNGEIYLRTAGDPGEWRATGLQAVTKALLGDVLVDARAFVTHRDTVTGVSSLFVGMHRPGRQGGGGIFRGVFDPSLPGRIAWDPEPESPSLARGWRIMGITVADGAVYASFGNLLLRREDGPSPRWTEVYRDERVAVTDSLRGAGEIRGPDGEPSLLFGIEGPNSRVVRVDPGAGHAATEELPLVDMLRRATGGIIAYNRPRVRPLGDDREMALLGVELLRPRRRALPPAGEVDLGRTFEWTDGLFLWRDSGPDPRYEMNRVFDDTLEVHPPLVGPRAILPRSPFPGEEEVIYFAGFDHNGHPFHNTGWIFKAHLDDVRQGVMELPQ